MLIATTTPWPILTLRNSINLGISNLGIYNLGVGDLLFRLAIGLSFGFFRLCGLLLLFLFFEVHDEGVNSFFDVFEGDWGDILIFAFGKFNQKNNEIWESLLEGRRVLFHDSLKDLACVEWKWIRYVILNFSIYIALLTEKANLMRVSLWVSMLWPKISKIDLIYMSEWISECDWVIKSYSNKSITIYIYKAYISIHICYTPLLLIILLPSWFQRTGHIWSNKIAAVKNQIFGIIILNSYEDSLKRLQELSLEFMWSKFLFLN